MARRILQAVGLVVALVSCAPTAVGAAEPNADLATGIRQTREGDFESALLSLDTAARSLATQPGRAGELAQAYLYMGVAYLGLGQESLARRKFQEALRHDPKLAPAADEFPLKVLRAFDAAKATLTETAVLQKEAGKKRGKGGLLLLGAGGLVAGGVAVAVTAKERANTPPVVTLAVSPGGQALVAATRLTFTATASDAEGDPLSYAWDFGDGTSGSGASVTRVYDREGTFTVRVSVGDGLATSTATASVTARTLSGTWRVVGTAFLGVTQYQLQQNGSQVSATMVLGGPYQGATRSSNPGLVSDPRTYLTTYPGGCVPNVPCPCNFAVSATVDSDLQGIRGTLSCSGAPACGCDGQTQAWQLQR